ncbi:MAG: HAD-IA family hydrolase [bacterium]|jgi:2-haloacid dehalogenase|nr:HAD-IA family hydrolase [bacterium]
MDAEPAARWATFDCYGTLIDWETGLADALCDVWPAEAPAALLDRFHRIEPEVERAQPGLPYRDVLAEVLRRLSAERNLPLTPDQERTLAAALPSWPVFPEVPAALAELRARGWRLGILSNTDPDLLAASIRTIGVPIDVSVTAAEARSYKPAPGHWRRFAELSGSAPDRQAHVAVSLFHDVVPAAELGIPAVWIDRPGELGNRAGRERAGAAAAVLPDCSGLPDTLDRLLPA